MTKSTAYQKVWNLLTQEWTSTSEFTQQLSGSPAGFWRIAAAEGAEGQRALLNWTLVVQALATTNTQALEPLLDKVLTLDLSPAWLAEEAIRTNHFALLESLIARQSIPALLNQTLRDPQRSKDNPTQTLGEILLFNASPSFVKKTIQHQYFDPTLQMEGSFHVFDSSSTPQSWTPLAWCVFRERWSVAEELLKNAKVKKDQQGLDEALFLLGFPQQLWSLEKSKEENRVIQIERMLALGANPNRSFELTRRSKTMQGQDVVLHEEWTTGLRWVYLLTNRNPKSVANLKGLDKVIYPFLDKLTPENWPFRPNVIYTSAIKNFQQTQRTPLMEKLLDLSTRIHERAQQDPILLPLTLSFKENEGWPLKWAEEQGFSLSTSRLKSAVKAHASSTLKKHMGMVSETYTFHGWTLDELKSLLPKAEQEAWQSFVDEFKRYTLAEKYSPQDRERLELFLKLEESKAPLSVKRL